MTTFARRVLGATGLKSSVYEEIEADPASLGQAAVVVLMSAVAAGIGSRGFGAKSEIPIMTFVAFAAWASWAVLTYQIGTRLLPDVNTQSDLRLATIAKA